MVTIKACYIDDERQYMEFKVQLTANNQIDENEKIFGVAVEWEKEKSNYTKWPFIFLQMMGIGLSSSGKEVAKLP